MIVEIESVHLNGGAHACAVHVYRTLETTNPLICIPNLIYCLHVFAVSIQKPYNIMFSFVHLMNALISSSIWLLVRLEKIKHRLLFTIDQLFTVYRLNELIMYACASFFVVVVVSLLLLPITFRVVISVFDVTHVVAVVRIFDWIVNHVKMVNKENNLFFHYNIFSSSLDLCAVCVYFLSSHCLIIENFERNKYQHFKRVSQFTMLKYRQRHINCVSVNHSIEIQKSTLPMAYAIELRNPLYYFYFGET